MSLTLETVSISLGGRQLVRDVSLDLSPGEVVGLLGPNGAGKTTTMRILTGFLPPTSGTARIAGFDVQEQPEEVRARIGYLPETPPLYLDMTTRGYLAFVARLKGLRGASVASVQGQALTAAPVAIKGTEGGAAASADIEITFHGAKPGVPFGACVHMDHIVMDRGSKAAKAARYGLNMTDEKTNFTGGFPGNSKSTASVLDAVHLFEGPDEDQRLRRWWTDSAPEFS